MFAPFLLSTPTTFIRTFLIRTSFPTGDSPSNSALAGGLPDQAHARGAAHVVIREHIPFLQFSPVPHLHVFRADPRIRSAPSSGSRRRAERGSRRSALRIESRRIPADRVASAAVSDAFPRPRVHGAISEALGSICNTLAPSDAMLCWIAKKIPAPISIIAIDRGDPDDDAEARQHRPHRVPPQRVQCRSQGAIDPVHGR